MRMKTKTKTKTKKFQININKQKKIGLYNNNNNENENENNNNNNNNENENVSNFSQILLRLIRLIRELECNFDLTKGKLSIEFNKIKTLRRIKCSSSLSMFMT